MYKRYIYRAGEIQESTIMGTEIIKIILVVNLEELVGIYWQVPAHLTCGKTPPLSQMLWLT